MSYSDRRLRQAAEEADRQQSNDTDESAFDEGLRQAAERQSESRDVRPGRGTEDRVVEREPSGDGGGASRPSPDPEPEPERDTTTEQRPDRGVSDDAGDSGAVDRAVEAAGGLADRATEAVESASARFSEEVSEFAERPVRQNVREAIGTGAEIETRVRTEEEQALVRGTGEIFNVPATAIGLAGAAGFLGARAGEVAGGRPGEAAEAVR